MKKKMMPQRVPISTLASKEKVVSLLFIVCCLTLVLISPAAIDRGPEAPPLEHSVAPWIFWPFQTLLLILPSWLAGLLFPLLFTLILTGLPWLDKLSNRLGFNVGVLFVSSVLVCLMLLMMVSIYLYKVRS